MPTIEIARIAIKDLPVRNSRIDYVVPRRTEVITSAGKRYAMNGDHIHGTRDRGGISLQVFNPHSCPDCGTL